MESLNCRIYGTRWCSRVDVIHREKELTQGFNEPEHYAADVEVAHYSEFALYFEVRHVDPQLPRAVDFDAVSEHLLWRWYGDEEEAVEAVHQRSTRCSVLQDGRSHVGG